MAAKEKVLITGAGGFIGHHLVKYLKGKGYWVRGVDITYPEYEPTAAYEFELLDLRRWENCFAVTEGIAHVYHLAARMGGIGFIEKHKAEIVHDNTLITMHMLEAARLRSIKKFLFASSACVYPRYRQDTPHAAPLKEEDAYPADAEDGYGWEKLYMERACRHYREDYGLTTYVVRLHNIYGPRGAYDGGREKSPAAICRKVARAKDHDEIEVWGDGKQARSYCYIDDCIEGLYRVMSSEHYEPVNLGTETSVTIDQLVDIVARIAGKKITKRYDVTKPQGVRGRNSDLTQLRKALAWEPRISLEQGLEATYRWIHGQLFRSKK